MHRCRTAALRRGLIILEAQDNNHAVGDGMQQALEYTKILDLPFAYSSNGDAFLAHDRTVTREIPLDQFPTREELWSSYRAAKGSRQGVINRLPRGLSGLPVDAPVRSSRRG